MARRTRLKVPKKFRLGSIMEQVAASIKEIASVKEVEANPKTGSLLITHRNDLGLLPALEKAIAARSPQLLDEMTREDSSADDNVSIIASFIGTYATRANRGFRSYTGNQLDLKTLLPLVFLVMGIEKASTTQRWWAQTPAYLFFYWAYDAFLRFHLYRVEERKENGFLPFSHN